MGSMFSASLTSSLRLKILSFTLLICMAGKPLFASPLRQLEKPLKDQFMVRRALEKALGYKSSAIDSSNDSSMPKRDKREPDDSFLSLVIWTPGETSQSNEPPEICCNSQETGKFCDRITWAFEKLACNEVKFNEDGTACFTYEVRNPIREFNGRRVWFNTIHAYDTSERGRRTTYMDGSPLSKEVLQAYSATLEDNCVDVKWVKGDVLLLDNLTVQHARRAGKPPRAVLVSLSN
ncbi:hypothetical protein J5N97_020078 [Dioscorea zingiberensis]|uniref:TauD/TfdA-like domain-containing protein n=1 Tax=Dioscorea zingiberensis TaxID=325984 RepID=A0A9D5CFY3_9LILI|nr:hypothetical protein J5N97_020078 [Dioscorea zingiberensis]